MPRGDGTGPAGEGPKTGKGAGRCNTDKTTVQPGGQGQGRGQGQGAGRGQGGRGQGGGGRGRGQK